MSFVRNNRFQVNESDVDTLIPARAALIAAVRARTPGLAGTRLVRLTDGTFVDTWTWDTAEQAIAAGPLVPTLPEAAAVLPLLRGAAAEDGELVDER